MSFDWTDFIRLADALIKSKDEASLRSGISRAYYGVFCIARNRKGFKNYKKPDVHRKVIDKYQNSNSNKERYIGRVLDGLRRERNDADYDEDKMISPSLAQRNLLKAKKILDKLGIKL